MKRGPKPVVGASAAMAIDLVAIMYFLPCIEHNDNGGEMCTGSIHIASKERMGISGS
jgi:hypothetical protein